MTQAAASQPPWLANLQWSTPVPLDRLRRERDLLPMASGIYVHTNFDGPLLQKYRLGVLYVGKATRLRNRVAAYLQHPDEVMLDRMESSSYRHKAKVNLLVQSASRLNGMQDSHMWLRWTELGPDALDNIEQMLIHHFRPAFNEQHNRR